MKKMIIPFLILIVLSSCSSKEEKAQKAIDLDGLPKTYYKHFVFDTNFNVLKAADINPF